MTNSFCFSVTTLKYPGGFTVVVDGGQHGKSVMHVIDGCEDTQRGALRVILMLWLISVGLHSPLGFSLGSAGDIPLDLSLVYPVHGQPNQ